MTTALTPGPPASPSDPTSPSDPASPSDPVSPSDPTSPSDPAEKQAPPESEEMAAPRVKMLTIAADLLPPEIIGARRTGRVKRIVLATLGAFVALMVAWYGSAYVRTETARTDLQRAEDEVSQLTRDQRKYDEVNLLKKQSEVINGQLAKLLAGDLQWAALIASIESAAPSGVTLTGVTGAIVDPAAARAGKATAGIAGAMTLNGEALGKPAVAAYVDALAKVPGLANPFLGSVTEEEGALKFTVRVEITNDALDGRFTPESVAPTAPVAPKAGG
jgi:hypothetical protein